MESAFLKGKMQFGFIEYKTDNPSNEILQDYRDSLIHFSIVKDCSL